METFLGLALNAASLECAAKISWVMVLAATGFRIGCGGELGCRAALQCMVATSDASDHNGELPLCQDCIWERVCM